MSIYAKLAEVLASQPIAEWRVGFAELERLIEAKLPASAFKYPGWWSNNPSNNAMTKIWLKAGWRTEQVDIPGQSVVFRKVSAKAATGFGDGSREYRLAGMRAPETKMATEEMILKAAGVTKEMGEERKTPFARLHGCMKGTFRIAPGVDLTEPTWGEEEWRAVEAKWDRLLPRKERRG